MITDHLLLHDLRDAEVLLSQLDGVLREVELWVVNPEEMIEAHTLFLDGLVLLLEALQKAPETLGDDIAQKVRGCLSRVSDLRTRLEKLESSTK